MTAFNGTVGQPTPIDYVVTASKTDLDYEGLVLKKNSSANTLELIAAKGDTAFAILDQAFVDSAQVGKTTATGDKVGVFIIGSGAMVYVASATTMTWTTGAAVYLHDTTDGVVTTSAATSRPVGHYIGAGEVTTANYDRIPIVLDVQIGATTV